MGPVIAMRRAQISLNEGVEAFLRRQFLSEFEPMGDRPVHGQHKRLDDKRFARFEMRVEAAMSETSELHQIDHAQAVGATLTQAIGGLFDYPAPGLQPMPFH